MLELQRSLYQGLAAGMGELAASGPSFALLLTAAAFGMVHALLPGHGKSVLVSYHLGQPGGIGGGILTASLLVLAHVGSAVVLVLAGLAAIGAALGRGNRADALEIASAGLIVLFGLWLTWRALRGHRRASASGGRMLALATGLVPCPLTMLILSYAVAREIVALGLAVVAAMAAGMIVTIGAFAVGSVVLRDRLTGPLDRTEGWRARAGRLLELAGALGVLAIGALMLVARLRI